MVNEPKSLIAAPNGKLWFVEESSGNTVRVDASGQLTEYLLPGMLNLGGVSATVRLRPTAIAIASDQKSVVFITGGQVGSFASGIQRRAKPCETDRDRGRTDGTCEIGLGDEHP